MTGIYRGAVDWRRVEAFAINTLAGESAFVTVFTRVGVGYIYTTGVRVTRVVSTCVVVIAVQVAAGTRCGHRENNRQQKRWEKRASARGVSLGGVGEFDPVCL